MDFRKHHWLVGVICLGLILALALPVSATQAQTAPPQRAPLSEVEVITMPPVDVKALLAEDQARFEAGLPVLRFAYPFPVQYSPMDVGTWETLNQDSLLWRLRIASPGALSLNLGFTRYRMPSGGQLLLYTPDYREIFGPFTEADNEDHGELWTPILLGDEIVVELSLPADSLPGLDLELGAINHGYVEFGVPRGPESGMCNVDVVCGAADGYPEIDAWRDEIRSAGAYSIGGVDTCSGALINNTAQDLTPYFLTADHCGINAGNAQTVVVYWNYENSWCRPPDTPPSGQDGDGQRNQFNSGSYFRAGYDPSDFTLIELDDPIDPGFNPHWAGWDRRDQATSSAVTIHHPGVEEKRISFENDPTSITDYLSDVPDPNGTHIRIEDWDLGTTEPGSSGSPLFSPERRIIGALTGGYAACYNDEPDWYGRVFVSWTGGGTPESRLSDWLDPLGIGAEFLDGRDIIETPFGLEVTPPTLEICAPGDATYSITVTQNVTDFVDPVTLSASGEPTGTTVVFSTNPVIPPGTSALTIGNTAAAPPGSYDIDVVATAATHTLTVTVGLDLATAIPAQPTLVSPPDGAVDVPRIDSPFEWSAVAGASAYRLQVDDDPAFGSPDFDVTGITTNTYTLAGPLELLTTYHWRVSGVNGCGESAFSDSFSFTVQDLSCILLVDDDNDAPDVRSYYTDALDSLGYEYDVFNAGSGNGPDLAGLEGYEMVIWFSGDKYGGTAGPNGTDETNLAAYLDGGGKLFLSSQDYLYDFGLTSFGEDYLGIGTYTNDDGDASTKYGVSGDPIGDGLGPYPLSYPANFDDYGDIVNAGAGASVAFTSSAGGGNNLDVDKDGGDWRTVFFGTSWVPIHNGSATNGEQVLGRIIGWFGGCECVPVSDAEFDWTPSVPVAGENMTFTGTASGTLPISFTWDFGDGDLGEGQTVSHAYDGEDVYTVVMTATNCEESWVTATHAVTVNPAPVCTDVASVDLTLVTVGTIYTDTLAEFEADVAPDDASKPYSYTVDYDDGTVVAGDSSDDPLALNHTFAATGTYAVEVAVWNCEMEVPATDVVTVTVYEQGACVDLAGITIQGETEGEPGVYTFTTSYEPVDASLPISYTWDNGDVESISVRSLGVGTHTLLVTATNCAEALVTGTHTIVVSGPPPEFYIYLPLVLRNSDS